MMTVSGFTHKAEAIARGLEYGRLGFDVALQTVTTAAGSTYTLICWERPA